MIVKRVSRKTVSEMVAEVSESKTSFFKAYAQLSPKIKKIDKMGSKQKEEAEALLEDIVKNMNSLSRLLGAKEK